MSTTQFQEMYQAARQAMEQGDRVRVRELAMQLLSMADSAWEKGEARTLLAWAGHGQLTASDAVSMSDGQSPTVRVTVVDFDMEFWSLVRLMVKAAIAAIPAVIILVFIAVAAAAVLPRCGGVGAWCAGNWMSGILKTCRPALPAPPHCVPGRELRGASRVPQSGPLRGSRGAGMAPLMGRPRDGTSGAKEVPSQ